MEKDGGRFFYLNRILCKTFGEDGSFRPSDIFPALDPDFSLATLTNSVAAGDQEQVKDESHVFVDGQNPSTLTASVRPNLDDEILNSFGVMSKGVLIDPWSGGFLDFTDPCIFTPSLFEIDKPSFRSFYQPSETAKGFVQGPSAPTKGSCARAQVQGLPAEAVTESETTEKLHSLNEQYYRIGDFGRIRPQACLIVCSSLKALDMSVRANEWKDKIFKDVTPLSWPYCNKFISYPLLNSVAKSYVDWLFANCELPSTILGSDPDTKRSFVRRLILMEKYRMLIKLRRPQSTYLPAGIPFPFQYRGLPLINDSPKEAADENDEQMASCKKPRAEANFTKLSPISLQDTALPRSDVRVEKPSAASSFGCFTGKSSMCRAAYSTIRSDIFSPSKTSNPTRDLRNYVLPLRALDCEKAGGMLNEIERRHLYPPKHLSAWARAWWLFGVYFHYLGLENALSTAEIEQNAGLELNSGQKRKTTLLEYKLCPDDQYSVVEQVQRKCIDEEKLLQNSDPDRSACCTVVRLKSSEIGDVWNFMINHEDRDRLLDRLRRIEMHLTELRSAKFKRRRNVS